MISVTLQYVMSEFEIQIKSIFRLKGLFIYLFAVWRDCLFIYLQIILLVKLFAKKNNP